MQEAVSKVEESFVKKLNCTVGPRCLAMVEGKCMMFSKDEKAKRKNPTPRKWAWRLFITVSTYLIIYYRINTERIIQNSNLMNN